MPRNTRNFWVELCVDGKKEDVGTGPRNRSGGFTESIYIRTPQGEISNYHLRIVGASYPSHLGPDKPNLKMRITLEPDNSASSIPLAYVEMPYFAARSDDDRLTVCTYDMDENENTIMFAGREANPFKFKTKAKQETSRFRKE